MDKKLSFLGLVRFAAIATLALPAAAQTGGGATEVIRPNGDPMPGVEVTLARLPGGAPVEHARTDAAGRFGFGKRVAGRYRLRFVPPPPPPLNAGGPVARRPKTSPDAGANSRFRPADAGAPPVAPSPMRVRINPGNPNALMRTFPADAATREIEIDVAAGEALAGIVTRDNLATR